MGDDRDFDSLLAYLRRVPSIQSSIGHGRGADKTWWVKFGVDITHPLAWHVVQEFGFVLNYISLNERLPTVFKPVSPPPYLNGGPRDYLSWVIECDDPSLKPGSVMKTLEGRLPRPVDDLDQWKHHDDDES
jgi:hypothetical protein